MDFCMNVRGCLRAIVFNLQVECTDLSLLVEFTNGRDMFALALFSIVHFILLKLVDICIMRDPVCDAQNMLL